jgi:hypothetical protein
MAALKQLYTLLNAILLAVQLTGCQRAARSSLLHFRLQAEAYSRISPSNRLPGFQVVLLACFTVPSNTQSFYAKLAFIARLINRGESSSGSRPSAYL